MKIWSAGCSDGSEPGSIMALLYARNKQLSAECLATDISKMLPTTSDPLVLDFYKGTDTNDAFVTLEGLHGQKILQPSLREMIQFKQENLLDAEYREDFDLVSCCNLLFYYGVDSEKRNQMITNLIEAVKPGGFLVVGEHSKRFFQEDFVLLALTVNDMTAVSTSGIFYKKPVRELPPVC